MGPGHSSSLCIGGDSSAVSGSGRTGGESDRLAMVVLRDAQGKPPSPFGKGKDKIDEIKYPVGSEYLKSAVKNALAVGSSRVEPLYGEIFPRRYRPPFGVQVWSPDVLTSYVVVPKMVCFFEVASENGLRFPLLPFIKRVLQHFNVCPSQRRPISKSSRPSTLRPSPPSVMKFSHDRPPVVKPTKGELQARVETLSRRSWSVKRKPLDSLEKSDPAWGKAPRLGTSSSSPSTHV